MDGLSLILKNQVVGLAETVLGSSANPDVGTRLPDKFQIAD